MEENKKILMIPRYQMSQNSVHPGGLFVAVGSCQNGNSHAMISIHILFIAVTRLLSKSLLDIAENCQCAFRAALLGASNALGKIDQLPASIFTVAVVGTSHKAALQHGLIIVQQLSSEPSKGHVISTHNLSCNIAAFTQD